MTTRKFANVKLIRYYEMDKEGARYLPHKCVPTEDMKGVCCCQGVPSHEVEPELQLPDFYA
jgi:hypothetical protein